MSLLRVQRYAPLTNAVVNYFVTGSAYDALGQPIVLELDPALFPTTGSYAVFRTTGTISNLATPVGPTATWIGGTHPLGYTVSAPFVATRVVESTPYACILVTVT